MNDPLTPIDVLSLPGFLRALLRHRWKVIGTTLLLSTLAFVYATARGRDYQSSAKLFVRVGRETVSVDPTAEASGQLISVTDTQEREIRSIVSLLSNRDLLEQAVDELSPQTILDYSEGDRDEVESPIKQAIGSVRSVVKSSLIGCGLLDEISGITLLKFLV
ncbi:MAG: Wzz/FepE/Etk N-terminal domain-containing protein, partial [Planctomycetota bacterium]